MAVSFPFCSSGVVLNDGKQAVVLSQFFHLGKELKVLQHILHVLTISIEIFDKVGVIDVVVI